MGDDHDAKRDGKGDAKAGAKPGRFLGSLRDALAAAGRDDQTRMPVAAAIEPPAAVAQFPPPFPKK